MRKTIYLTCLLISVLISTAARSQEITLNRDGASLQDLFLEIHHQTGYFFYYSNKDLSGAKPVTIHVNKAPLEEVLNLCFAGQPLVYRLENKTIVVQKKPVVNQPPIDIKGKILNEQGDPVEDVTVGVQGSRIATTTNSEGEFILDKIPDESILVLSHVGYQTQTLSLKKKIDLTVILKRLVSKLDEVQVIAYGTTTHRLNTGDVSSVTHETIENQPVSNPLAALEGRVPGLVITQQTGVPGGGFSVLLRGQNSIANGNNPFYIVDGVPFSSTAVMTSAMNILIARGSSPLNNLNPADIESIEVLKDADATAIYGSRGANGVILITTKKGRPGKNKIDLQAYTGIGKVTRLMPLLNTQQYLQMRHEAFANDGAVPNPSRDYDLTMWDTTRYTNWQKLLLGGTARTSDVQGSISGGNENTQFLLGGGYHQESTVFPGNYKDQKAMVHVNLNTHSDNKKFGANFTASYVSDQNHLPGTDFDVFISPIPDTPPIYDSSGKLNWANGTFSNPFGYVLQNYNIATENLISNAMLTYQILPALQLKVSGGYTKMHVDETQLLPGNSYNPSYNILSSAKFGTSSIATWILEPQVEYILNIGKGKLMALAGGSFQSDTKSNLTQVANGFSSDALLSNIAAASSVNIDISNTSYSTYRYEAFFTRLNYIYQEKYILNLNARRDGSSRFGPGKQFANFGSAGVAWIFSKERGVQENVKWLSFGKLRASYGLTGNDQIGDYQYLSTYYPTYFAYQNIAGLEPTQLQNPNYEWETVKKAEVGISLGFFQDRILVEASYFRNRSSNQLVGYPLPAVTGFNSITENLPAIVQNSGLEVELSTVNFKFKDFNWTSSFNLTIPSNRLIAYPDISNSSYANTYVVGKPLSVVFALHNLGVDPAKGVYTFQDVNQNGSGFDIPGDLQALKKVAKDYYGGVLNSFKYKGFQLDIFFQIVKQTGYNYITSFNTPGTMANQPTIVMERWQKPGDITSIQQFTQGGGSGAAFLSYLYGQGIGDKRISDASFIRLKNCYFSYQIPLARKSDQIISSCKIFIQGQNLLTITHYLGNDPENNGTGFLPPLKMLTAGIQITF